MLCLGMLNSYAQERYYDKVFTDLTITQNVKYAETIVAADLEKHLTILASDSLEGRETGKPGQKMAADYIMNHFKNIGYKLNLFQDQK